MEANHKKFLGHLDASEEFVWIVARWLRSQGHSVTVSPTRRAHKHEDWKDNADNGDLYINKRIEVKHLSREFSCVSDWPFGEDFIVCAKHSYDNAVPKPYGFVILNKSCTVAAIVQGSTADKWSVKIRTDNRYEGVEQEFYFCPLSEVQFVPFPEVKM